MLWGGSEEQAAEIAAGNLDAKDWQDEAKQIVENTVSPMCFGCDFLTCKQMAQYYKTRPSAVAIVNEAVENGEPASNVLKRCLIMISSITHSSPKMQMRAGPRNFVHILPLCQ